MKEQAHENVALDDKRTKRFREFIFELKVAAAEINADKIIA